MHYLRSTKTAFTFLISLIFFFFISGIYAQKPTLKEKVISNSDKYLPYGMDLKKYDWSDKEMNLLLEEVEKYRISRKKLLVAGGIGIGLGVLTHFYNMDSNPGNCNSYFLGYDKCKDTKKLYWQTQILAISEIAIGSGLLIGAKYKRRKQDEITIRAIKRYRKLGFME